MTGIDTSFLLEAELAEHPRHVAARRLQDDLLDLNERFALTPAVVNEFVHVVTDARRFQHPLSIAQAIDRAQEIWLAPEVLHVFPTDASEDLFFDWLRAHDLGRKRLLDTQLAATLWAAGIRRIVTSNPGDFRGVGFETLTP